MNNQELINAMAFLRNDLAELKNDLAELKNDLKKIDDILFPTKAETRETNNAY